MSGIPESRKRKLKASRGQQESPSKITLPVHDPSCYLCPGNVRAAGHSNPAYPTTFVFVNDYSAVKEDQPDYEQPAAESADGKHSRSPKTHGNCFFPG